METDYSPSPSGEKIEEWKLFSIGGVLSWLLFIITGWISFWEPNIRTKWEEHPSYKGILFWLYPTFITTDGIVYSIYIFYLFFFPLLILSLLIISIGFFIYIYFLFIKKESNVISAMFGRFTKYHFVPFLCGSVLSLISEFTDDHKVYVEITKFQTFLTIVISFLGLVSISFIYLQTKIEYPMLAKLTINRGTFSCLLALFSIGFCYNITYFGYLIRSENYRDKPSSKKWEDLKNWVKGCNYAFSIILGTINMGLSFFFKDIVLAGINCLMYVGMTINFFAISDKELEYYFDNKRIVGIIDIVFALASIGLASFLFVRYNPFRQIMNE